MQRLISSVALRSARVGTLRLTERFMSAGKYCHSNILLPVVFQMGSSQTSHSVSTGPPGEVEVKFTEQELKQRLTPLQYQVTQEQGTEKPFTGELNFNKETGIYSCIVCGSDLFKSDHKFDSGSGWPSFFDVMNSDAVAKHVDKSHGMARTEVTCKKCGAHLGHVFSDGPNPTGERYCINSASLDFKKSKPKSEL